MCFHNRSRIDEWSRVRHFVDMDGRQMIDNVKLPTGEKRRRKPPATHYKVDVQKLVELDTGCEGLQTIRYGSAIRGKPLIGCDGGGIAPHCRQETSHAGGLNGLIKIDTFDSQECLSIGNEQS